MIQSRNLRRTVLVPSLAAICVLAVFSVPTLAHGPCGSTGSSCLSPKGGPPGTLVSTTQGLTGQRVVWNPSPDTLLLGVPGTSSDCDIECAAGKPMYHDDLPMLVVAEEEERAPLEFEVPDVPPGRYLVVVYDGSESGQHYTWNVFEVTAGSKRSDESDGPSLSNRLWWLLVPAAAGLAGWFRYRSRRRLL